MKQFTLEDLRALKPCYDPAKYLPEDWRGTALDILDVKAAPFSDRLWTVLHTEFFSDKFLRLFAVWCARQVQHLMKDERSVTALDVAEAFANGSATKEELIIASDAATGAADAAARAATGAADADADADARAARAADAAARAAWAAARADVYAARAATWAAASAREAATWAAAAREAAARDAARAAQENKLREMIIAEIETGDVR